ncbi:MAG: hypothetical protein BGO41_00970 [Clostridiales bacterium 38-18]|nr:MAG: hypothetical protein BGO41_00970 [Clostridiales bacterium 38-18]
MSELLGIIAPIRKVLSNTKEDILVEVDGGHKKILELNDKRKYQIPDFQREIRWDKDNLSQLIEDIKSGPKYLGNIILTKKINEDIFLIIDGQQRMTVLTMILHALKYIHQNKIGLIEPCKLEIESFEGFTRLLENHFDISEVEKININETDMLHQYNKYHDLWTEIIKTDCIKIKEDADLFIKNLRKSTLNIIINKSDELIDGIGYFIDVNLKGRQLDTEDIFKAYLFSKDCGVDIRKEWYDLTKNAKKIESTKMKYPILKLLEHYFYCDLYNDEKYVNLVFDESFLVKNEFKTHDEHQKKYRARTHLIEVINDNTYMLNSLRKINKICELMLNIVNSSSPDSVFRSLFNCVEVKGKAVRIDSDELEVFHNLLCKILKDDKSLPKALVMKYILNLFIDPEPKNKAEYKQIYSVYLLSVLFIVFENNKSKEVFSSVLKAKYKEWNHETIKQIKSYFSVDRITDNKIITKMNQHSEEDEADYRFRCKSLATIYNFFSVENDNVILIGNLKDLKKFIYDEEVFSIEHLIIPQNKDRKILLEINGNPIEYHIAKEIYNKYVNSLFNFIFIPSVLNSELGNFWLPRKLDVLNHNEMKCLYSKLVIDSLSDLCKEMQNDILIENYKDKLDLYFSRDFKFKYVDYAKKVLSEVIDKINSGSNK